MLAVRMTPPPQPGWFLYLLTGKGSSSPGVFSRLLVVGLISTVSYVASRYGYVVPLPVGPFEVGGAVVGLMLGFRANTGYNRYWEGRTLWGGIVNACRNLARQFRYHSFMTEAELRETSTWIVVFAHVTRRRLRLETQWPEIERLLSAEQSHAIHSAHHPALYAAGELSARVATLVREKKMDPMMAAPTEELISQLVDRLGGCERIFKTPTPPGFVLLIRRVIMLYLALLPLALLGRLGPLMPLVTVLVAYPILMLEAMGTELDDPFGHDANDLPLSRICETIERDVLPVALQETEMASVNLTTRNTMFPSDSR